MKEIMEIRAIVPGLVKVLETQFPQTATIPTAPYVDKQSRYLAARIVRSIEEPEGYFGLVTTNEMERLQRFRKAAVEFVRASAALSRPERMRLDLAIGTDNIIGKILDPDSNPDGWPSVEIEMLVSAIGKQSGVVEKERKVLPQASGRRNWEIAALAGTCREIWGEQEWIANPERYGKAPIRNALRSDYYSVENQELIRRYEMHVRDFANKYEKKDGPGPFGKFLEDVLTIVTPDCDERSSAQSALRSWRDARKQLS